jgi:hypothetical protein
LLGENIDTVQREVEALLDVSKEDSLEAKAERAKYIWNLATKMHNTRTEKESSENRARSNYLGTRQIDPNCTHEEM